jgi:hypothetical protein
MPLVPPSDPGLCPDLQVARPDDFEGAVSSPVTFPEPWKVKFGGRAGKWHDVSVIGRAFCPGPDSREIVDIEWSARRERWTETYFAEPGKMRKRWK